MDYILNEEDDIKIINKYKYFIPMMVPNNVNNFQVKNREYNVHYIHYVRKYYKNFVMLLFPVFKHRWINCKLILKKKDKIPKQYLVLDTKNNKDNLSFIDYSSFEYDGELSYQANNKLYIYSKSIDKYLTLEAYSYLALRNRIKILLDDITYEETLGLMESAIKLGILSLPFKTKKREEESENFVQLFNFVRIELKSLYITNQLKLFELWLEKKNMLITGGTGIGKTSQIPKVLWWINYMFDGYDTFDIPFDDYLQIELNLPNNFTNRKTLLSLPRKILITENAKSVLKSIGFNEFPDSPIYCNYKDVKQSEYYNKTYSKFINPFLFSVNNLTSKNMNDVNTLIFDEVHEHDMWCDIAIAIAKSTKKRYNIRNIVLISATIDDDKERIDEFLNPVHIHIKGKTLFNINVKKNNGDDLLKSIYDNLPKNGNASLVFLASVSKLINVKHKLKEYFKKRRFTNYVIYLLHGKAEDRNDLLDYIQNKNDNYSKSPGIYGSKPSKNNKIIILSTPIAESSLTINNAEIIIDTGKFFAKIFLSGKELFITESMRKQRMGRVGRVFPGTYVQMFKDEDIMKDYKKIDCHYLAPYIIIANKFGFDYKKDLFVLPTSIDRFDRTIDHFRSKNVNLFDINIYDLLIYNFCNLYEYIKLYNKLLNVNISYKTKKRIEILQYCDNNSFLSEDSKLMLIKDYLIEELNIECEILSFRTLLDENDNTYYDFNIKLKDDYDFNPLVPNILRYKSYKNLNKYSKIYMLSTSLIVGKY